VTVSKLETAPVLRAVPSVLRSDATVTEFLQPIRGMLDDSRVNELCVNQPGEVFVERAGVWQRHEIPEFTFRHCQSLATAIATLASPIASRPVRWAIATAHPSQRPSISTAIRSISASAIPAYASYSRYSTLFPVGEVSRTMPRNTAMPPYRGAVTSPCSSARSIGISVSRQRGAPPLTGGRKATSSPSFNDAARPAYSPLIATAVDAQRAVSRGCPTVSACHRAATSSPSASSTQASPRPSCSR